MSQGDSYIDVSLAVQSTSHTNDTTHLLLVYVASDEDHGKSATLLSSFCELTKSAHALEKLPYVYASKVQNLELRLEACATQPDNDPPLTCRRQLRHETRFAVDHTAWHSVYFISCDGPDGRASHASSSSSDTALPVVTLQAAVAFRNPYGFLPAELSGLLPSQLLRLLLCAATTVYFVAVAHRHRAALQPLHGAVLLLLALALVEAAVWTAAFVGTLNGGGRPYCCPFPATVGAALVLQVLRQALSRGVLLVVCLGYGIVRPRLLLLEWTLLALLTAGYLAAALANQAMSLMRFTSLAQAARGTPWPVQAAAALADLVFLLWICAALQSTMRVLAEYRQTAKLALYASLWRLLSSAVVAFVLVSLLFALDDADVIDAGAAVHWRLTWLQPALWDLLNVLVLLAVAYLCLPSERARLLEDAAQEADMEMVLLKQRGGFVSRRLLTHDAFSARLSDDDRDDWAAPRRSGGLGGGGGGTRLSPPPTTTATSRSALHADDGDDDEFGLRSAE
eukprot:gene9974-7133_t